MKKLRAVLTILFSLTFSFSAFAEPVRLGSSMRVPRAGERDKTPPFYLGVLVGADPVRWGDLRGTEGEAGIQAICSDLKIQGMNAVWVSGFDGWNAGATQMPLWLDAARGNGLKVVFQGSGGSFALKTGVPRIQIVLHLRREVLSTWRSVAEQFGTHPALLAYVPVQEVLDNVERGEKHTLWALVRVAEVVSAIDAVHPVITVYNPSQEAVADAEIALRGKSMGAVVVTLHVFRYSQEWVDSQTPDQSPLEATREYLDGVSRFVALGRSAGVPAWIIGQAHESVLFSRELGERPGARMPTKAEMSFQIWGAILNGAKGIFFFSYQSFQPPPLDAQGALDQWETSTGMWTLKGDPTTAYEGAMEMAGRLRPHLPLLGRLTMETKAIELDPSPILAARFRDSLDRTKYVVLLNRDVTQPHTLKELTTKLGKFTEPVTLAPGDGAIFRFKLQEGILEPFFPAPSQKS